MKNKWEDIYPKQFDCLWARFQGYKDKKIDEITSYHDQSRPYIVLFFKDGYYYSLPMCSTYGPKSFYVDYSYIRVNELYKIRREDFISKKYILTNEEQDKLINYITSLYWNNFLLWQDIEYDNFLKTLKSPKAMDIIKLIDDNNLYMCLRTSKRFYLVSNIVYPYKLKLVNNREFVKTYKGDKRLYYEIGYKKKIFKSIDCLSTAYLFNYNGSSVISLYQEDEDLYCLNLNTRKVFKIDYLTLYTFNNCRILNTLEKYEYLKKLNVHIKEVEDCLSLLEDKLNAQKLQLKKD